MLHDALYKNIGGQLFLPFARPALLFVAHGKSHRAIMQAGQPFV
jgi:hypothetical protein